MAMLLARVAEPPPMPMLFVAEAVEPAPRATLLVPLLLAPFPLVALPPMATPLVPLASV
jgi:hypothetical protein